MNEARLKRVAALYDIHGNLPALEAVLDEIAFANVDHIVVGGDVVPGPMAREALALLRSVDVPVWFIQGNGEAATFQERVGIYPERLPDHARLVIRWTSQMFSRGEIEEIAGWPMTFSCEVEDIGTVLFCHGTPRHHNEIFTSRTDEARLRPLFDPLGVDIVVCGHTHMPFDRRVGSTRVVNAGSVGLPFGVPGADWLLLGQDIELRHTSYDLESAATRTLTSGYIDATGFAAQVLQPPDAEQMLDAFAGAELAYS